MGVAPRAIWLPFTKHLVASAIAAFTMFVSAASWIHPPLRMAAALAETAPAVQIPDNLVKGDLYISSSRGERLHLRTYIPPDPAAIKAVCFFFHGYTGHSSSVPKRQLAEYLCEHGIAVIQPDLLGHGYSEGVRAYALDWNHWLDDHRLLLELIAGGPNPVNTAVPSAAATRSPRATAAAAVAAGVAAAMQDSLDSDSSGSSSSSSSEGNSHNVGLTQQQAERLAQVPIFLSGESLGGAQALALGVQLQEDAAADNAAAAGAGAADAERKSVAQRFAGVCLIAPAIKGKVPPRPLVALLRYCVVPFIPQRRVPAFLDTVAIPAAVWKREEDIAAYKRDLWGVTPQGIIPRIKFPFLVLHDPGDQIVLFAGTQLLRDGAKTPLDREPSRSRQVIELPGELHDLLRNCNDTVVAAFNDWMQDRLSRLQ